jgi:hypothetical protein
MRPKENKFSDKQKLNFITNKTSLKEFLKSLDQEEK